MKAEQYCKQGNIVVNEITSEIGVSKMTLHKYLKIWKSLDW